MQSSSSSTEKSRLVVNEGYSTSSPSGGWTVLKDFSVQINNARPKSYLLIIGVIVLFISLSVLMLHSVSNYELKHGGRRALKLSSDEPEFESQSLSTTYPKGTTVEEDLKEYESMVQTPLGSLVPVERNSRDGRKFYAFYKVPYAKPPVGDLMFESPEPAEEWAETRIETQVAPQCLQKEKYGDKSASSGDMDCLYMNIYTPKLPKNIENVTELMPTLVYIHGGGFVSGNGSRYGAEYFMDEDVLLVTFQFRLGIFGFLNTGDGRVTGNMGYKDQVMALKWIQSYIKYFGGDPKRVMIFGNSSGGTAVCLHFLSPMSKGLFHRGISQSGGSLPANTINPKPEVTVQAIGNATGCSTNSIKKFIRCLRNTNPSELVAINGDGIDYSTTLERNGTDENSFITEYPLNILQSGKLNEASLIIGVNSAERLSEALVYLKYPELTKLLNENWTEFAPKFLDFKSSAIDPDTMAWRIRDFYFGEHKIGNETMKNLTNLLTDKGMLHKSKVEAVYQAAVNNVYLYYLTKEAAKTYSEKAKEGFPSMYYGPSHADEIQFLFPYYGYPAISKESKYYNFSKTLVKIWSRFAATGQPYYSPWQDWKPVKPSEKFEEWYMLDDQSEMVDILEQRMEFWDQFSPSELKY